VKILVTGSEGYIGTVLVQRLLTGGFEVIGTDACFFSNSALENCDRSYQFEAVDIRDLNPSDLEGVEAVAHLAALSNDPLGDFDVALTNEINRDATIRLAELAKLAGVRRFVYASSQSMYGISNSDEELDEDLSEKHPLTAYARTKWEAELALKNLGTPSFELVFLRPSTVFGASPRLRCDIVFNNLVACAYTTGRIEIKSDGTPWRPVVHVQDVCSAIIASLLAPASVVAGKAFNVGIPDGNFSVRDLAEAASEAVPNCELIFTGEHGKDARSYKVSFNRILTELAPWYKPEWTLERGGQELVEFFDRVGFRESDFRGAKTNRLQQLRYLSEASLIGPDLRWRT